jgi:hypothetical protein
MSAIDTAQCVIDWAMTAHTQSVAPPIGDARGTEQLIRPPESLCKALGELTAIISARLRLGDPPLGDRRPVGVGNCILAVAIGMSAIPENGRILMTAVPWSQSPVDWVARHGIVFPALPFLTDELIEDCLLQSPLTALLHRPAKGQDDQAIELLYFMLKNKDGKRSLTLHLAQPTQDRHVRDFRYQLLDRLRLGEIHEQDFVLDVYEAMMIHHETHVMHQIKDARAVFTTPDKASDEIQLQEALSVASFWGPLWAIERSNVDALRARRYLGYAYRQGLALYQIARKLTGGNL